MIFNFSDKENTKLNNIQNKFYKVQRKSSNSYRVGFINNIYFDYEPNEIHKRIIYSDRVEKIKDYVYRFYFDNENKQITNVKQILDLSYNFEYIPLKIEDDFIDFSTFPNKDICLNNEQSANKRTQLFLKYDEIEKEYILQPKQETSINSFYGKMMLVNNINIYPKYKNNKLFKIETNTLLDKPDEYFIDEDEKQLIYITIIIKNKKIMLYKKYFNSYDSLTTKNNEYFNKINSNSKYIFKSDDLNAELSKLKSLGITKSTLGINEQTIGIKNSMMNTVDFDIDSRWRLKFSMYDINRFKDINNGIIISIPILNIPTSKNIYPFYKDTPITNYIDGRYNTDLLLNMRENLKIVDNRQIYDGGTF